MELSIFRIYTIHIDARTCIQAMLILCVRMHFAFEIFHPLIIYSLNRYLCVVAPSIGIYILFLCSIYHMCVCVCILQMCLQSQLSFATVHLIPQFKRYLSHTCYTKLNATIK